MPDPPKGDACLIDYHADKAYCSDIPTAVSDPNHPKTSIKPLISLDKGMGFDSETVKNLQKYIKVLRDGAKLNCGP